MTYSERLVGIWRGAVRTAKYVAVDMPAGILGWNHLKSGHGFVRSLWQTLTYPSCPDCDGGLLTPQPGESALETQPGGRTDEVVPWRCHRCDFEMYAPNDLKAATMAAQVARNALVRDALQDLDEDRRGELARAHAYHARAFFAASALTSAGSAYMVATGASWLTAFQWALMAGTLWIFGMKKSYRSWQARTGTIFQRGSLWRWFRDEKWLV